MVNRPSEADIHKPRYRTHALDLKERYRSNDRSLLCLCEKGTRHCPATCKKVLDILEKYLANVRCPAVISAPGPIGS